MNSDSRWKLAIAGLVVAGAILGWASPLMAQDETEETEEPEPRLGRLFTEISVWIAQPGGLDYTAATRANPADPLGTRTVPVRHGTDTRGRYRVGYELPNKVGGLMFTYYSHEDLTALAEVDPGRFVFGEVLAHPLHAGLNDDGRADAFSIDTQTQLRDVRVDFYRPAFESDRVRGTWFVGIRRVFHRREQEAEYFAVVHGLPPLLPPLTNPRPDLVPQPDIARLSSKYEGRGIEAGLDVEFPMWGDKLVVEGGVALGALRGNTDTSYASATYLYAIVDTLGNITEILAPPFDEFNEFIPAGDPTGFPVIQSIQQLQIPIGLNSQRTSTSSAVLDTFFGLRWHAWKGLQVLGGIRTTYYDNVGVDLRPKQVTVPLGDPSNTLTPNLVDMDEMKRSVTYEGFYFGIAYRQ